MRLVKCVKVSRSQIMAIYELSSEVAQRYGKRYLLSSSQFRKDLVEKRDDEYFISRLQKHYYEELFETEMEAYLTAKLVGAQIQLDRLNGIIRDIQKTELHELRW